MFAGITGDFDPGVLFDAPNRELAQYQGRWVSPDPAGSGWNQYVYPTDPLSSTDPSGLYSVSYSVGDLNGCGAMSVSCGVIGGLDEFDLLSLINTRYVLVPLFPDAVPGVLLPGFDWETGEVLPPLITLGFGLDWDHAINYYPNASAATLLDQVNPPPPGRPANNSKKSLLNCTINTANKLTITNGIAQIPGVGSLIPEGSWARAGVDIAGGGNAISGLLATGQTLFGNSASGTDLAQTGAGILLDPSMGLGPALEAGGINVPSALGALTDTVAEGATGVGLLKLGADFLLTLGSGAYCAVTQ